MKILIEWIIRTLVILITAYIVPGVKVEGYLPAFLVALVLGLLNTFIKPVIKFLTFPLYLLTLGLISFVINALFLMLASKLVQGFSIDSFMTALMASLVISVISALLGMVFK